MKMFFNGVYVTEIKELSFKDEDEDEKSYQ